MNIYNGILALCVSSCFANASVTLIDFEIDPNADAPFYEDVGFLEDYQGLRFQCLENGVPNVHYPSEWNSSGWGYYERGAWGSIPGGPIPGADVGVIGDRAAFTPFYSNQWHNPANTRWSISRVNGGDWHFFGAWFTAMWNPGNIRVQGIKDGQTVFDYSQSISSEYRSWLSYGAENEIDTLLIWNNVSGQFDDRKHFVMDNFYYMEAVPAPGVFALGMFSLAIGTSRRRK